MRLPSASFCPTLVGGLHASVTLKSVQPFRSIDLALTLYSRLLIRVRNDEPHVLSVGADPNIVQWYRSGIVSVVRIQLRTIVGDLHIPVVSIR